MVNLQLMQRLGSKIPCASTAYSLIYVQKYACSSHKGEAVSRLSNNLLNDSQIIFRSIIKTAMDSCPSDSDVKNLLFRYYNCRWYLPDIRDKFVNYSIFSMKITEEDAQQVYEILEQIPRPIDIEHVSDDVKEHMIKMSKYRELLERAKKTYSTQKEDEYKDGNNEEEPVQKSKILNVPQKIFPISEHLSCNLDKANDTMKNFGLKSSTVKTPKRQYLNTATIDNEDLGSAKIFDNVIGGLFTKYNNTATTAHQILNSIRKTYYALEERYKNLEEKNKELRNKLRNTIEEIRKLEEAASSNANVSKDEYLGTEKLEVLKLEEELKQTTEQLEKAYAIIGNLRGEYVKLHEKFMQEKYRNSKKDAIEQE